MVTSWRGRDAHALREALRMSLDDFARHVGVSRRGAARWSANPLARLRWDTQRALDRALATAPTEARQRFHAGATRHDTAPHHEPPRHEAPRAKAAPQDTAPRGEAARLEAAREHAHRNERRAAMPWVRSLGEVLMPQPATAAPQALFRLERAVAHARLGFQACRYEQTAGELPHLMRALAEARADAAQRFPERLTRLASSVYQVTASLLLKVDDVSLALLAADRGVREAEDPLTQASATRVMAEALIRAGHPEQALALESNVDGEGARELSLRGALHLTRAVAAAHLGEATDDLMRAEAIDVDGNFAWTGFGKANVGLHRAVVARLLGMPEAARDALSKVDVARLPYPERREAYFLELGLASTPASARC